MLTLSEQWILLVLDEKTGRLKIPRSVFQCGITGGMLFELAHANRLHLVDGNKVNALDAKLLNDPLLAKALKLIAKAKKPQTILHWMIHLTMQDSRVIESFYFKQMLDQGLLKKEKQTILDFFRSKHALPASEEFKSKILQSLKKVICKKYSSDNRPLCLLGLVSRSGYAEKILGKEQASLLTQYSSEIFSQLEGKHFTPTLIPFFFAILEALTLSQQAVGTH